jgi:hypothetical protein
MATQTPLPEPHASIVEELSEQEVAALISVKRRFDERSGVEAHRADDKRPPDEFFALF